MASKERCKPGCDCTGWAPIPLKPNMCSLCGHSMVFHDDDDVSAVSVHSGRNTLEERQKQKEAELAPLKRKSVVQLYAPLFEGKKEEAPTKIEAPRRARHSQAVPEEDTKEVEERERRKREEDEAARRKREADDAARRKREEEEAAARKKREDDELAARLARQKLEEDAKKPKCGHCNNPINGGYMIFPDRGNAKVHNECQQAFLEAQCEKCSHCRDILFPVPGKFKGEFMIIGSNKVHVECYDAYRGGGSGGAGGSSSSSTSAGDMGNCKQCGKVITTSAMRYENGDRVHNECVDAYIVATSDKCKHCLGPIAVISGKFAGTYYIIGSEKVHTECFEAFQKK